MDKTWDNRKERRGPRGEYRGWDRRMKWTERDGTIRIQFEDSDGTIRIEYKDRDNAQAEWQAFKAGDRSVQHYRRAGYR